MRIYSITGLGRTYLVRAANRAQAVRHVAEGVFAVKVASQEDLVELLPTVKVADATAEAAE